MKDKIIDAIKDMSKKIERDSKHVYRNPITGDVYQGVSSVSSIIPKDWLAAWGAKEAVKALGYSDYPDTKLAEEVWQQIKECKDVKEYVKILHNAKGASTRKSKKAMVDGKLGHMWLELFVQGKITGQKLASDLSEIPQEALKRPLQQFLDWEAKEVDYWIASEAFVVHPEKRYAGQLDAIYMSKTGRLTMCDFKFASHISEDYFLQTAGYCAPFEAYGIRFDDRVIIRLPKTLEKDEWNQKTFSYDKVSNDIEVKVVTTDYDNDREIFFHALPLKSWVNQFTKY